MKEIKDYLKYYIGCEVIGKYDDENRRGILTGIKNGSYECEIQFFEEDGFNVFEWPEFNDSSDIKLRLRRLDSMTYDEFIEAGKIHVDAGGKIQITFEEAKSGHNRATYPEVFHYLLSRGFDLFDLIDSGLAIDINLPTQ